MANQNQKVEEKKELENGQAQNNGTEQTGTTVNQNQPETTEKQTFGSFCKKHWKGLVAGLTGALALGGSAVVAYRKGKAAGMGCVPMTQEEPEDYSLNPNE